MVMGPIQKYKRWGHEEKYEFLGRHCIDDGYEDAVFDDDRGVNEAVGEQDKQDKE